MQPITPTLLNILSPITFKVKGGIADYPNHEYQIKLIAERGIAEASVAPQGQQGGQRVDCNWQATPDCTLANLTRIMLQQHPQMLARIEKKTGELKIEAVDVYRILEKEKRKRVQKLLKQLKKACPTHIEIEITATLQGKNYLLQLCPSNLKQSKAFLIQQGKEGSQIALDLGFLERFSLEDLRALFSKEFASFIRFKIKQREGKECLCLSPLNPSFAPLASLKSTKGLINYLDQASPQHPLAKKILKNMVDAFIGMNQPSEEIVEEMIEILDHLESDDQVRVFRSTAKHFVDNILSDQNVFKLLTKILLSFQRQLYLQQIDNTESSHFLFTGKVDPNNLVTFLVKLSESLKPQLFTQNLTFTQNRLKALIALLEMMITNELKGVNKEVYFDAYKAINEIVHHKEIKKDLETRFFSLYGKHSFFKVSNDYDGVDAAQDIGARAFYLVRGFAKIASGISLFEPWQAAAGAFESIKDFKKAFAFGKDVVQLRRWFAKKQWFTSLLAMRFCLLNNRVKLFDELKNLQVGAKILEQPIFHSPLFLVGFVHILKEILYLPMHVPLDFEAKELAIALLQRIYQANQEKQASNLTTPFCLKSERKRHELCRIIKHALLDSKAHVNSEIKNKIDHLLRALDPNENIATTQTETESNELFKQAASQSPLFTAIKRVARRLEKDDQLQKEKVYYIAPNVREDQSFSDPFPFKQALDAFFESEQASVLHLEGDGGAGKTLAMKMLTQKLLNNYSNNGYFPIYTYLGSLLDPLGKIVEETFALHRIEAAQIDELISRKVVFICDAVDEINPERLKVEAKDLNTINMYETNGFADKGINKVIFVSKKGFGEAHRFQPRGRLIQKFILAPFNDEQIFAYLDKFAKEQENKPNNPLSAWTADVYKETFEKLKGSLLWDLISNPFRLHVTVEVLPIMMMNDPDMKIEDIVTQQTKGQIEQRFFDIFACVQAYRAHLKKKQRTISPQRFLMYSAKLAAAMENKGIYSIPYQPSAENDEEDEMWLPKDDKPTSSSTSTELSKSKGKEKEGETDTIVATATENKLKVSPEVQEIIDKYFKEEFKVYYKECLVLRNNEWSFIHRDYQLHLSQYGNYFGRSNRFEEILKTYRFDQWIVPE